MYNKAVFLDRDGVINVERGDYTYRKEDFHLIKGVPAAIFKLKAQGYLIIVVTNQAGISRGIYSLEMMEECHKKMMDLCNHEIDAVYYAPLHPSVSLSLARKPNSLLFERALSKYQLNPKLCWMVGDKQRDLDPAAKLGLLTIGVGNQPLIADYQFDNLSNAVPTILKKNS